MNRKEVKQRANDILDAIKKRQEQREAEQEIFNYSLDDILEASQLAGLAIAMEYGPMEAEGYIMSNPTAMKDRTVALLKKGKND